MAVQYRVNLQVVSLIKHQHFQVALLTTTASLGEDQNYWIRTKYW